MKRISFFAGLVAFCAIFCALVLSPGCEEADGLYQLYLDPSNIELTYASNSVSLTVVGTSNALALPLEWRVSNPDLGYIAFETGYSALYYRYSDNGDNVVIVKDQYENEGFATIRQISGPGALTIQKVRADTNTWTVSVVNPGPGLYEWWERKPAIGQVVSIGNGSSAVYDVKVFGERNDVYVRDRNGNIGSISIP